MPAEPKGNLALRRAFATARVREVDVASSLDVDPKTVRRWLDGRLPHPRHRWALADLLGVHEYDVWPELVGMAAIGPEIAATYAQRAAVPREVWRELFAGARTEVGVLVYSGLFLAEDAELVQLLAARARDGAAVRVLLGDPDDPHVAQRGAEEGIDAAMAAKVRNAIVLFRPLAATVGAEIRLHSTVLYNSIYRGDDEILVNPHVYGVGASRAPVFHLRRRHEGDMVSTYVDSFERVWEGARALEST